MRSVLISLLSAVFSTSCNGLSPLFSDVALIPKNLVQNSPILKADHKFYHVDFNVADTLSTSIHSSQVSSTKPEALSVLHHSQATLSSSFTCEKLPSAYDPHIFCSGVVDYDFVIATGTSSAKLDAQARAVASGYNSFLNNGCLTDIKRAICSAVYLRCLPNGEILFHPLSL